MRAGGNSRLIALDGTWYFSSQSENIHCPHCSHIEHENGECTHFPSAITPVIVSPSHKEVVPLRVNWLEVTIIEKEGEVIYRNSFITDWKV